MKAVTISDQVLLTSYMSGDKSAISTLIERHRRKVYNYILLLVKNPYTADDLFQETFIKVLKSLDDGRYSENGKFLSWVLRIAHNQIIDHFRQQKQMNHYSTDDEGYDVLNNKKLVDDNVEDQMISAQIAGDIRKLLDFLPVEQKEVVIMRHYLGLSFKDIADQTGVSINTALGRMRYALMNLRKLIEEKNISLTA